MTERKQSDPELASNDVTSAGVPWSEVPEFARRDVEWMEGRHGSAKDVRRSPVDLNIGVSSYLLALAVLIPASGWMADRFEACSERATDAG